MTVYLVGSGPGDPGLFTVKGNELLKRAEVVIHDRLAASSLLSLAPAGAEIIDVGKRPGSSIHQKEINALLVDKGRQHEVVVRLKGGDPFVLGRGGEEALALANAGIEYEVVPGISAAIAAPAYAGVPVTHRGLSEAFTVITGHQGATGNELGRPGIDWDALAKLGGTVVLLMGVAHRAEIAERLMNGGRPPTTPVAAVRWGTRGYQATVRTTLKELGEVDIDSPSTIVIGEVAGLELNWFEGKPMFGRRIVVTRARRQASVLSEKIRELGAEPVEAPVIEIGPPSDGGRSLKMAAGLVDKYDWLVFTSANAVRPTIEEIYRVGACDSRGLAQLKLAAIGSGTAKALEDYGLKADLVPPKFVAESLLESFPDATQDPDATAAERHEGGLGTAPRPKVLLARARVARDVLPDGLRQKGWEVDIAEAYETVRPSFGDAERSTLISVLGDSDAVAFTSSSTVTGFVELFGKEALPPVVVCIGPVTAQTAAELGIEITAVAKRHDIEGLVEALLDTLPSGHTSIGDVEESEVRI